MGRNDEVLAVPRKAHMRIHMGMKRKTIECRVPLLKPLRSNQTRCYISSKKQIASAVETSRIQAAQFAVWIILWDPFSTVKDGNCPVLVCYRQIPGRVDRAGLGVMGFVESCDGRRSAVSILYDRTLVARLVVVSLWYPNVTVSIRADILCVDKTRQRLYQRPLWIAQNVNIALVGRVD